MEQSSAANDVLFILLGAIMVLAMHAGFAFLEVGTVRKKNQVNALVKILADFAVSTLAYFFIGYGVAYGAHCRVRPGVARACGSGVAGLYERRAHRGHPGARICLAGERGRVHLRRAGNAGYSVD